MRKLLKAISGNQILTFTALYALRQIPKSIWDFLLWRYTTELTVFNEDSAFDRVSEWLGSQEYTKKTRNLRLTTSYRNDDGEVLQSPGIGRHLIWFEGRPVLVSRYLPNNRTISSWKRGEDITIRMLGPSPEPMRKMVQEIVEVRRKTGEKTIEVYLYRGYWKMACRKAKRPMESVVLPGDQKDRIVRDLEYFLGAKQWYLDRGIPYRRGALLFGPPGCGKTSFVMALAGHLQRPIYALNLGSLQGDEALIDAITSVPEHGILLIEDIDVAKASRPRELSPEKTSVSPEEAILAAEKEKKGKEAAAPGITLSALLNALDGAFSRDGRILVMTTNHPENVDPALLRPGRTDIRERIGELGREEVYLMCKQFLATEEQALRVSREVDVPIIPAELQEKLLRIAQEGEPKPKSNGNGKKEATAFLEGPYA